MMVDTTEVLNAIVSMTQELIRIKSVSDQTNKGVIDFVEKELIKNDFEVEVQSYLDKNGVEKYNIVGKLGKGDGGLALIAHSDVVPGQEDKWDAFKPAIKGEKLYGRGSCDMKGAIATMLHNIRDIDPKKLKHPVWVIITADEEISSVGAKYMLEHSKLLKDQKPAYGIIGEPTKMLPIYAHKGWATFDITAIGTAAHTSIDTGKSANFIIAPFLAELAELKALFLTDPSYMNKEFDPPTNGFNMIINDFNTPLNVTSNKTHCGLSYRVMHNANSEKILETIKEKAKKYGLKLEYQYTSGLYTDPNSKIVTETLKVTNEKSAITAPYNTDGAIFNKIIKELIIIGPGNIEQAHTIGEFVEISELLKAYQTYAKLLESLCFQE